MNKDIHIVNYDENENNRMQKPKFWKFRIIMILISLLLVVVLVKLIDIQLINHEKYSEIARKQHHTKVKINPARGIIYDKNGNILSKDILSISIACDPSLFKSNKADEKKIKLQKLKEICNELALISNYSSDYYFQKIINSNSEFMWLLRHQHPHKVENLRKIKFRGLIFIEEQRRFYPYSELASQVIGCTNVDHIGISGIESLLDSILRGNGGYMYLHRDGLGYLRPSASLPIQEATHGNDVYLTIDINIQQIVEYELKQGIDRFGAEAGLVIAMNSKTGEIIAIASYPNFDPNELNRQSLHSLRIKGISDTYEPGSTFKLIPAAIALEEKIISKNEIFDGYDGLYQTNAFAIRDEHPLRDADLATAFKYSSNIIFAQIAARMKSQTITSYIKKFGFGAAISMELPGEAKGKIPDADKISYNDKLYLGFGYGLTVTPLQLLTAYNSIANSGKLIRPYIIDRITSKNGDIIFQNSTHIIGNTVSETTARTLTDLLVNVVENGTGKNAKINGLKIAGKTGTSQQYESGGYSKEFYNASFVGFFPAEDPKISMIVILERPKSEIYGGATSALIFKKIVQKWMNTTEGIKIFALSK